MTEKEALEILTGNREDYNSYARALHIAIKVLRAYVADIEKNEREEKANEVISVINLKGGVAKTFTAYNMAYELAKRGYTVLLLDNDKQGNLSKAAGAYESTGVCAAARAITGEYKNPLKDLIVEHPQCNNIDIIPANMSLMQAVWQIGNSTGNQIDSYEK